MDSDQPRQATPGNSAVINDDEIAAALEAAGYAGEEYEKFAIRMVKVTLPVLAHLIATGAAFDKLRRVGRGKNPTRWEKQQFRLDPQIAFELASDAQAKTLSRFLKLARAGKGWGAWRTDGGASMKTWFINGCILDFANVYETWRKKLPPYERSFEDLEPFLSERPDEDTSPESLLGGLTDREIETLMLHIIDGWKHKEIADLEGISEAASQERLRRAKIKLRRLHRRADEQN